jgi:hypothetical protein
MLPHDSASGPSGANVHMDLSTTSTIPDSIASSLAPPMTPTAMYPGIPPPNGPIQYSETWNDALMEHLIESKKRDDSSHKQSQPGLQFTPNTLPISPIGINQSALAIDPNNPFPAPLQYPTLPLPPIHPLRTFPVPTNHPHAAHLPLLTHPHGSLYGGPPPDIEADLQAYAADIMDAQGVMHRSGMVRYLKREMNKQVEELERRMKARKSAKETNARTAKALRDLERERQSEIKAADRWRLEMQRKRARAARGGRG